jgi:hypothetical protein
MKNIFQMPVKVTNNNHQVHILLALPLSHALEWNELTATPSMAKCPVQKHTI